MSYQRDTAVALRRLAQTLLRYELTRAGRDVTTPTENEIDLYVTKCAPLLKASDIEQIAARVDLYGCYSVGPWAPTLPVSQHTQFIRDHY